MRLPVRSEADAFRSVFVLAAAVAVTVAVGYAVGFLAALAVLCGLALAATAWMTANDAPAQSLREAESAVAPDSGTQNILLVVNAAPTAEQLREAVLARRGRRARLEVHAPVLQSRTHFVTTDIDSETQQARLRLARTLNAARAQGARVTGEVGDPIDPLAGVQDELRRFPADEVIVATHRPEQASWVERELLERMQAELAKPVRQLVVDRGG
jgi:hypothetical protein